MFFRSSKRVKYLQTQISFFENLMRKINDEINLEILLNFCSNLLSNLQSLWDEKNNSRVIIEIKTELNFLVSFLSQNKILNDQVRNYLISHLNKLIVLLELRLEFEKLSKNSGNDIIKLERLESPSE